MKNKKIDGIIALYKFARFFMRLLPSRVALALGSGLGILIGATRSSETLVSLTQLKYAFPKGIIPQKARPGVDRAKDSSGSDNGAGRLISLEEYPKFARNIYGHIGEGIAEMLIMERFFEPALSAKDFPNKDFSKGPYRYISSSGDEVIDQLTANKQAAIGFSAHFGCYELLAAFLARRGLRATVIGRRPNYPLLEKMLSEARDSYGLEAIWRDSPTASRQIVQALRKGRTLCVLLDQDTNLANGFAPFFGLEAASPISPVQMAIRYKVPLFSAFISRSSRMHHHVSIEEIPYSPEDPLVERKVLETYNERLEELIRSKPEQWVWWHRRWRRRPEVNYEKSPELLPSTEEYLRWIEEQTS